MRDGVLGPRLPFTFRLDHLAWTGLTLTLGPWEVRLGFLRNRFTVWDRKVWNIVEEFRISANDR